MKLIAAGDPDAVRVFVDTFSRRLLAYLLGLVRDREDARDLAQETLIRCCSKAHSYNGKAPLSAWTFKVARNLHIDRLRGRNMQVHLKTVEIEDVRPSTLCSANAGSPETTTARKEIAERVGKAIAELPERQRDVAQLRLLGELSLEEIAEVAGLTIGGVKSTLHNALQALRPKLADLR